MRQTSESINKGGEACLDGAVLCAEGGDGDAGRQELCERGLLRREACAVYSSDPITFCRGASECARHCLAQCRRIQLHNVAPTGTAHRRWHHAPHGHQKPCKQHPAPQRVIHSAHQLRR